VGEGKGKEGGGGGGEKKRKKKRKRPQCHEKRIFFSREKEVRKRKRIEFKE
jgi:hypothetical protein